MIFEIAEWIVLALAIVMIASGVIFIRQRVPNGGVTHVVLASNAVFTIATVVAVCGVFSWLHLLWIYPVSFFVGSLVLLPPFTLFLRPLAIFYGRLCCL